MPGAGRQTGASRSAMSCWHVLMGKRYSLLAGSSGTAPAACCTAASWSTRFSSSDAEAEHEEMVNELQAMMLIGDQWANAPDHPAAAAEYDPLSPNIDHETATTWRIAREDGDYCNTMTQGTADVDETGSGSAPKKVNTVVDDDSKNLYSTAVKSTRVAESLPPPISNSEPVVDSTLPVGQVDELLPFPVYEDARPPGDASPSLSSAAGSLESGHLLRVASGEAILDDDEEPNEGSSQRPPVPAEFCDIPMHLEGTSQLLTVDVEFRDVRVQGEEDSSDNEVNGLDKPLTERRRDDQDSVDPEPQRCASSSLLLTDTAPRRPSQLSATLRDNLERLLQRGPVSSATSGGDRRRRRTKRDDGLTTSGRRQTTISGDHQHHHRRQNHHHHHRRHPHHHHHQSQHQQEEEEKEKSYELYEVQSLMTDTSTQRSLSVTSLSGISSVSYGILYARIIYMHAIVHTTVDRHR